MDRPDVTLAALLRHLRPLVLAATLVASLASGTTGNAADPAPADRAPGTAAQPSAPEAAPAAPSPQSPATQSPATQPTAAPVTPPPAAPVAQPPAAKAAEASQPAIDGLKVEIDQIAAGLLRQGLSDRALGDLRARAEVVKSKADALVNDQKPALEAVNARVKQLGPPPVVKEGEPPPIEADAVRLERESQAKAVAQIEGIVKQAQLIGLEADEVIKTSSDRRRARFTETVIEQTRSVLDPSLWFEAAAALPRAATALQYLVGDWFGLVMSRGGDLVIALLCLVIVVIAAVLIPLRRQLFRLVDRNPALEKPTLLSKTSAAMGIVAINVGAPAIGFSGLFFALHSLDLGRDRTDQAFIALAEAIALGNAVYSLALAILPTAKPQWRLVPVSDTHSGQMRRLFGLLAVTSGLGLLVTRMLDILSTSISLVIAGAGLFAVTDSILILLILRVVSRTFATEAAEATAGTAPTGEQRRASLLWRWLVPLAWIAALGCIVAAVLGYVALAQFIAQQMIWFGVVLGVLFIGLQLIDEGVTATFHSSTPLGHALNRSMGFSRETVEQIGVILSGLLRLAAIAAAAYFVRPPWGDNSTDVLANARTAFFGIRIGNFTFSPASVLMGLAAFAVGVTITRGVQSWLDQRYLPRTRLDAGLKNSIRTSFGYLGYVVAAGIAFSSVGIGLDNVALVAGALSVGIGFGLQSIVNNFVSGLILLAERPIKSGDLVEIGAEKGYVRKINVRSTEIETFDRATLIVPNSSLITGSLKNWMHRDQTGRCVVNVGVGYEADGERVRDILVAAAKEHRLVMPFPAPAAFFVEFGDKALDFRLICAVANVNDAFVVESDLRFSILKRFRKEGIDIPAAQRDITVREFKGLDQLIASQIPLHAPQQRSTPD